MVKKKRGDGMGGKTGEERKTLKEGDPRGWRHLRKKPIVRE